MRLKVYLDLDSLIVILIDSNLLIILQEGIMWDKDIDDSYQYNEPLGAALAQLDHNKERSTAHVDLGVDNPMFDTTDL